MILGINILMELGLDIQFSEKLLLVVKGNTKDINHLWLI